MSITPAVIVHGGAGHRKTPASMKALKAAAGSALETLQRGATAVDAVEAAIRLLENFGIFNAGLGAVAQRDGKRRLDASIMDGSSLRCGAVGALEGVPNPIAVARKVMEATPHVLLVGTAASAFAEQHGLRQPKEGLPASAGNSRPSSAGTVGAVAVDKRGRVCAGASTGGLKGAWAGRVGDSALIGCGVYACEQAGATATGIGEAAIRLTLSARACRLIAEGLTPQRAVEDCVREVSGRFRVACGMIALDRSGRPGVAFNTPSMPWVFKRPHG